MLSDRPSVLLRMQTLDLGLCRSLNASLHHHPAVGAFFAAISRIGDGICWYTLMLILPLIHGTTGLVAALHMGVTGAVALVIYRWLKTGTSRPRPCNVVPGIKQRSAALDQFSFPSGHTLHAVAFTTVLIGWFPAWAIVLVPLCVLIALSRPILGLHYPSDVLAGALIGVAIGSASLQVFHPF